jgi:hypothetical protein
LILLSISSSLKAALFLLPLAVEVIGKVALLPSPNSVVVFPSKAGAEAVKPCPSTLVATLSAVFTPSGALELKANLPVAKVLPNMVCISV